MNSIKSYVKTDYCYKSLCISWIN